MHFVHGNITNTKYSSRVKNIFDIVYFPRFYSQGQKGEIHYLLVLVSIFRSPRYIVLYYFSNFESNDKIRFRAEFQCNIYKK